MNTSNLRKKSTYDLQKQKYISNRKRQDYEKDLEESDPDEYENDLNDLKQRLHIINYNYYTEALRLALIEKSRPLMPLKLGPLVQKQTLQADYLRGVNGQTAITGQFNQGNILQYNDLTSQTYKQMYQNQQNYQHIRQSQSSPKLINSQNNPYGNQQYQRNSFQNYPAQNLDAVQLPQINQSAVYQKPKYKEQLPMISSPTGSNQGQNRLSFDQQQYINNLQTQQMNYPQYDTTKLQQQRLTQLGTPYDNQEYFQVIDGKKYKIKQMSVNSPQIQVFGADEYAQQRKKKKSVFHSKQNDQMYSKKQLRDYEQQEEEDQYDQPVSKSRKSINARSKRNIEMKSQKKIDNYEDDGYDDQEDYDDNYKRSRQSKSKLKSKQQIKYDQDDDEEDQYNTRSRKRNKSRKLSRAQEQEDGDYDDNRSVRSNKRSKSRKNTVSSRRGGDYQEENDDDYIQKGKKKNKSKFFKNEDIDDLDDLDEFKPKQNATNDNQSEYDNTKNQRKKTFIKSRNQDDEFNQDDRTQNQTQKKKKTIIINEDNQDSKYKRRDATEKKKTVLMSKNQIKSLKHLKDLEADDL
ncbi:hypothetical protein TTHERM_00191690 (macronuclear) [Tetrahymena thermophila SB210]|uniref:Uncharacterized protein n=1 Tax=Tetrahymena thermophila (strain SB210) TaxID=312017 RepID=I7MEK0_TETTS|nr:hypothetical protein TTHERM_00191690 [Tetrahymena thermophila SB210]EAR96500.2 hypothetical protein TTHERM_00191690 [Tetrahymena thermophila SB210]|eukprot:XP_001016745.2 hypothetical protein TTHERM_00191690 [Tetrahymena thermophila SB210]